MIRTLADQIADLDARLITAAESDSPVAPEYRDRLLDARLLLMADRDRN